MDGKTEQFTKAIYETVVTESIRSYKVMFNNNHTFSALLTGLHHLLTVKSSLHYY